MPLLNDITLGRYVPGQSWLHTLDPRAKILALGGVVGALMLTESGVYLAIVAILVLAASGSARLPSGLLLGNLRPLLPLLLLTFGLNALLTPGDTVLVLHVGDLRFTDDGIVRGLFLAGRFAALVLAAALLTLSTSPLELADGLEALLKPFRRIGVPTHELALTTTIALRFIPILIDEADRLRNAQLARGADFGGGPIRRVRGMLPLLLPLFVSAFGRADRLAVAMEARCYRGGGGRSRYKVLVFRGADYIAFAVAAALTGAAWLSR